MRTLLFCLLIIGLARTANGWAFLDFTGDSAGTTALSTLKIPVGGKAVSLGGCQLTGLEDGSMLYWNPSLLGGIYHYQAYLSHQEIFTGLRQEYIAFMAPIPHWGGFGFSANYTGTLGSGISAARDMDETAGEIRMGDLETAVSYGKSFFWEAFYLGAQAKVLWSQLDDESAVGAALDLSATGNYFGFLQAAVNFKNIGPSITYIQNREPLPFGILGDVSASLMQEKLFVHLALQHYLASPVKTSVGAAYHPIKPLSIHAGYQFSLQTDNESAVLDGLTAGFELTWSPFAFQYGVKRENAFLGYRHSFSLQYNLKKLKGIGADDYLERARRRFGQKQFRIAIRLAEQAIKINSSLWAAHVLIDECHRQLKQTASNEVAIVFTGNTRGYFNPVSGGLGGLSRRSAYFQDVAARFPAAIRIDAGNFLKPGSDSLIRNSYGRALSYLKYDAVGFGENELGLGLGLVRETARKNKVQYICSNVRSLSQDPAFCPYQLISRAGYSFLVLNVLPETAASDTLNVEGVVNSLRQLLKEKTGFYDYCLLLCAEDERGCRYFAQHLPKVSLIISTGFTSPTLKPVVFTAPNRSPVHIVGPGQNGEYTGLYQVSFGPNRKLSSYQFRMTALDPKIGDDQALHRMLAGSLETVTALGGQKLTAEEKQAMLAFVSNRDGPWDIFYTCLSSRTFTAYTGPQRKYMPTPSPDGSFIAFVMDTINVRGDTLKALYCLNLQTNIAQPVFREVQDVSGLAWGDNQTLYAAVKEHGQYDIYVKGALLGYLINLTNTPNSNEWGMAISPDRNALAFTSDRQGGAQIFLSGPMGQKPIRLSLKDGYYSHPAWSPANEKLAAIYHPDRAERDYGDLEVIDVSENSVQALTQNLMVRELSWTDENTLVYAAGVNYTDLNLIDVSTGKARKLTAFADFKPFQERNPVLRWVGGKPVIVFAILRPEGQNIGMVYLDGSGFKLVAISPKGGGNWLK
jgi:hypothetical protein